MINHVGRRGRYWKKWLPLKNIGHTELIFHVHIPGAYMTMCKVFCD